MTDADERFAQVLVDPPPAIRREDRWLVVAPEAIAFAADTDAEWARLTVEQALLARWRGAGIPVPRVVRHDDARRVQVRERMDGLTGEVIEPLLFGTSSLPDGRLRLAAECPLSAFGQRLAHSYGELAARMHAVMNVDEARAIGLAAKAPFEVDTVLALLRAAPIEPRLVDGAVRARAWIAAPPPAPYDRVVHGDLHFHNMVCAPDGTITGVFDLGDAHLDAPESELHYIHSLGPKFVDAVLAAYETPLDVPAIRRAHVRTALGHLMWVPPSSPRYPVILGWISAVLEELVPC